MNVSDSPIDTKQLLEIMDDDDELLRECLDDFLHDYPGILDKIKSAIDNRTWDDLERAAHSFKGSLKYLAAKNAAETASQLEIMGRDHLLQDADVVFSRLSEQCQQIELFIDNY